MLPLYWPSPVRRTKHSQQPHSLISLLLSAHIDRFSNPAAIALFWTYEDNILPRQLRCL